MIYKVILRISIYAKCRFQRHRDTFPIPCAAYQVRAHASPTSYSGIPDPGDMLFGYAKKPFGPGKAG